MRIAPFAAAVLALSGCPYLFDPPDLSHVPCRSDAGSSPPGPGRCGADTATTTPPGTTTDSTPTDPNPGDPPTVLTFSVAPRTDAVVAHFALADLNTDLVGGSLDLSNGSQHWVLAIPADIEHWDPLGASSTTLYYGSWLDCTTSVHESWTLTVTDLAGHVGVPATTSLDITALGLLPEAGAIPNAWPDGAHTVSDAPPFTGCVAWETNAVDPRNILPQLRGDVEGLFVQTPDSGNYVAQLWWTRACDVDITVYPVPLADVDLDGYYDTIATAWTSGNTAEIATWPGIPGASWFVDLPFFQPLQGQAPPFQAQFLVTPE